VPLNGKAVKKSDYLCAVLPVNTQACIAYGVWAVGADSDHNLCQLSSLQ